MFRDDSGGLLAEPYPVSFLTAAAPNRASFLAVLEKVFRRRALRVLAVAAAHGHRRVVLGVWECGVFGNDPDLVARIFADPLGEAPWFDEVVFAVLDRQEGAPTFTAFVDVLLKA